MRRKGNIRARLEKLEARIAHRVCGDCKVPKTVVIIPTVCGRGAYLLEEGGIEVREEYVETPPKGRCGRCGREWKNIIARPRVGIEMSKLQELTYGE